MASAEQKCSKLSARDIAFERECAFYKHVGVAGLRDLENWDMTNVVAWMITLLVMFFIPVPIYFAG
jgi:hypothetical protein